MANPTADKAAAQSLGFVAADFPAGWVATPHQRDPSDAALNRKLAACAGASDPSKQSVDLNSPDFDKGNAEVSSEVAFAPTRAAYDQDIKALQSGKYESCINQLFATELQAQLTKSSPGVKLGPLTLSRFATRTYGDVTVALRLATSLTGPTGTSIRLSIDLIEYGQNRSEVSLTFSNQGAPFDPVVERLLVGRAVDKLKTVTTS